MENWVDSCGVQLLKEIAFGTSMAERKEDLLPFAPEMIAAVSCPALEGCVVCAIEICVVVVVTCSTDGSTTNTY